MDKQQGLWQFIVEQSDKIAQQTITHIGLTMASLLIALVIGLPLGLLIARKPTWATPVLALVGVLQTIPSIALLGFLIPLLGIGGLPAITALFLYALLPIIRNTYTGITEVDHSVVDAARAMGMTETQILFRVQLPLAMPVILAGVRIATVINVGVATLAAYIAAGGLGEFIFGGIALNNTNMILAGAIPAALLAIMFDWALSRLQRLQLRKLYRATMIFSFLVILLSWLYLIPATSGQLLAGFTPEFMGRNDGYLGLKSKYHLNIRNVVVSDAVMYKAAYENRLDVISGYSTDGRLKAFDLIILKDDRSIFPPYYAAPLVRTEIIRQYPELPGVLNMLAGKIDDSIMTNLNYRVDYLKQLPEKVARDFLISAKLYRPPQQAGAGIVRIGSKIFGEQYILSYIYKMLIEGYTPLKVETFTGLGGTKICFDALIHQRIDLYPEYTGTGLLVILQPPAPQVAAVMSQPDSVYRWVKTAFARKYRLSWLAPIGFNNAYALMMKRSRARQLNIQSISDLKRYTDQQ